MGTREVVGIITVFLIVQFAGFFVAALVLYTSNVNVVLSRLDGTSAIALSYIIDFVLFSTLILMFLNRHRKNESMLWDHRLFVSFEAMVIVATSFFAFLFFFTAVLPAAYQGVYFPIALGSAIAITLMKEVSRRARNTATIISSIGVGLVLGFYLNFTYAIIALAFLAFYDYMAVFVTKAMTKLAQKLIDEDMAFLVSEEDIEAIPKRDVSKKEAAEYLGYIHETKEDSDPLFKEILLVGNIPIVSQIELGEGDLGLPLMAAVSVFATFRNYFLAFSTIFGAALGLIAALWFLRKYRVPLPAIPPLFSFIAIISGIALTSYRYISVQFGAALVITGLFVLLFGMAFTLNSMRKKKEI